MKYAVPTPKTKLYCYYHHICSQCGSLHWYRKPKEQVGYGCVTRLSNKPADDKLMLAQAKVKKYNSIAKKVEPYILNYWKALKEIWNTPKTTSYDDYLILEKHHLGNINRYFGAKINNYFHFQWDFTLTDLNNQLKFKL